MILLQQETPIHEIADTLGLVLSIPTLTALISIVWFAAKVKNAAENTANSLKETTERITAILDRHQEAIDDNQIKIAVLWDGHERRHGVSDRRNT
jgi:hypothetical protein